MLYSRISFKLNSCKNQQVTKTSTKPKSLKGNLLLKMCWELMSRGRASTLIFFCLTGSDWSGANKIAVRCKILPRRSSLGIKGYWWKTNSSGVSLTIAVGHNVLSPLLCAGKWIIKWECLGRENWDCSGRWGRSNLWGVPPSLEKVAFFLVSAVNLVERRGNTTAWKIRINQV